MTTRTYKEGQADAYESFLFLKTRFPKAFFFQVMGEKGPKLSVIGLKAYKTLKNQDNILEGLSQVLKENQKPANFPFEHGGAFGCLGHEIITLIEPTLKKSGYLKDASADAEIMLVKDLVVFEHEKNEVHITTNDLDVDLTDLRTSEQKLTKTHSIDFGLMTAHLGKETFLDGVKTIKEHIRQGNIFQAVLSERFEKKIESSPLNVFQKVRSLGKSAYSFYFDFEDSAFFGSSPESFLTIHNDSLTTHPIAGTRPRGKDEANDLVMEEELKNCPKEAAEHLMLVDLARNDLGRVSEPKTVKVSAFRTLLRLPNVMHLVSEVVGTKRKTSTAVEAFKACFPAGTLSGAPKVRALEILSQIETRPRGFYGGAVVAFDFGGNLESCIAIRSIEVKNQVAILRAGAGIVADSVPEKEYEEIEHKLKGMMQALSAAEASLYDHSY
jgi:anthranilate synthase component 1